MLCKCKCLKLVNVSEKPCKSILSYVKLLFFCDHNHKHGDDNHNHEQGNGVKSFLNDEVFFYFWVAFAPLFWRQLLGHWI